MSAVVKLDDPDDKSSKQKSFRKRFADNLNAALNRRGAIPSGYGRVVGVAELFGVSQNTAANWLKGDGVPELSRLPEIADALGTTIEQLLVGDRETGSQAKAGIAQWMSFYNRQRPHTAHRGLTPAAVYWNTVQPDQQLRRVA